MYMNNKKIAITWAIEQVNIATGFVYSDQFFRPFKSIDTHKMIIRELYKNNVIVWFDTKEGAFLFKRNDSRLRIESNGQIQVGLWMEDENILLLPSMYVC